MSNSEYAKIRVDHMLGLEEGDLIQFCPKYITRNSKKIGDSALDLMTGLVVDIPRFTGRYVDAKLIDVLIHETEEVRTISLQWNKIWKLIETKE